MMKWTSMKFAPKDGTLILVHDSHRRYLVSYMEDRWMTPAYELVKPQAWCSIPGIPVRKL